MKAFAFSLQRVLDVKSARESHAEQSLAAAILDAEETRRRIKQLQAELLEHLAHLEALRGSTSRSDRLKSHLQYLDTVHDKLDERSSILLSQEQRIETLREQLLQAMRERKTLEHLRERERKEWTLAGKRAEQKVTDEAAAVLFGRRHEDETALSLEQGGYSR